MTSCSDVQPRQAKRKRNAAAAWLLTGSLLIAALTLPFILIAQILLMLLFMQHGQSGPIEPAWIAPLALSGAMVAASAAVAFVLGGLGKLRGRDGLTLGIIAAIAIPVLWYGREAWLGVPLEPNSVLGGFAHALLCTTPSAAGFMALGTATRPAAID